MGLKPIEVRVGKDSRGYFVNVVWPGICNVTFGQRRFLKQRDALTYCANEWHGVPVIKE